MGVSGGGGDPLVARVVDVDAVELILFIPSGSRALSLAYGSAVVGGGKNCCAAAGSGAVAGPSLL